MSMRLLLPVAVLCIALGAAAEPYRDGDTVVFLGDSITHGGSYHAYIADYYRTRFPAADIRFVNAGLSGDTAAGALARVTEDVAARTPTQVAVHFGMNDVGRSAYLPVATTESLAEQAAARERYRVSLTKLVENVRAAAPSARLTYLTPTPYDERVVITNAPPNRTGWASVNNVGCNAALGAFAGFVLEKGKADGVPTVDWYSPLDRFLRERQAVDPHFRITRIDRVHPEALGHAIMSWTFLRVQGVPADVSNVSVDAVGGTAKTVRAEVSDVVCDDGCLSFTVLAEALPFPVPREAVPYLKAFDVEETLNREVLVVTGLATGRYSLLIDDEPVGTYSDGELADGVRLGFNARTPQYRQAQRVFARIEELRQEEMAVRSAEAVRWVYGRQGAPVDDLQAFAAWFEKNEPDKMGFFARWMPDYLTHWPVRQEVRAHLLRDQLAVRELARPVPRRYRVIPVRSPESVFRNPPAAARPWVWWHWMDGHVSKTGITADLEAMREVGIGGATVFDITSGIRRGPVVFGTDAWYEHLRFAVSEAKRLGLEIQVPTCSGWSASGGPWITPERSMKTVVFSETKVKGPCRFLDVLPMPKDTNGFYSDIAVLAVPVPAGEGASVPCATHCISCRGDSGGTLEFVSDEVLSARGISFVLVGGRQWNEPARMQVSVSDDGRAWADACTLNFDVRRCGCGVKTKRYYAFPKPVCGRRFRVSFAFPPDRTSPGYCDGYVGEFEIREAALERKVGLTDLEGKTFQVRQNVRPTVCASEPRDVVDLARIRVLTEALGEDGRLKADLPSGDWALLRIGYASNGVCNHPADGPCSGLEVDKLDADAVRFHFESYLGKLCGRLGEDLTGPSGGLTGVLLDSYEVGAQNWTRGFEKTFVRKKGYELIPYLALFSGRIVGSVAESERVLADYRSVIADMFAENYAGTLSALCRARGLSLGIECYGNGPFDSLSYGRASDIPMGEFWAARGCGVTSTTGIGGEGCARLASSIAHVNRRQIAGMESFTAFPWDGKWQKDPFSLKAQGDRVLARGVNRLYIHRYAHQPWTNPLRVPGMTMAAWGTPFERTQTWWLQSKGYLSYLTRAQALLQDGIPAVDCLMVVPVRTPDGGGDAASVSKGWPRPPEGYDFDWCMAEQARDPSIASRAAVVAGSTEEAERKLRILGLGPDVVCETDEARSSLAWCHRRHANDVESYFIAWGNAGSGRDITCSFRQSGKAVELWDAETGEIRRARRVAEDGARTKVTFSLQPSGSIFVVFRPTSEARLEDEPYVGDRREFPASWRLSIAGKAIRLDSLRDWTSFDDPDIRYFSGTASYETALTDWPGGIVDLGVVRNLAEVYTNGVLCASLWRPPFRFRLAAAREIRLEVRVTNLWPNRLIGDAFKADDGAWSEKGVITEIPSWVENGSPSPSGRSTFATWRLWTTNDVPLSSGLLGPVQAEAEGIGWPVLKSYGGACLEKVKMPVGGIGTGTISLSGRGGLVDWELQNRPAKGYVPVTRDWPPSFTPSFTIRCRQDGKTVMRLLEGPVPVGEYEGAMGSRAPNAGFPRVEKTVFKAAYPLAQVEFSDVELPVEVRLEAMNPLVPGDSAASGMPVALVRWRLKNVTSQAVDTSVCATFVNFCGVDPGRCNFKDVIRGERDWTDGVLRGVVFEGRKKWQTTPDGTLLADPSDGVFLVATPLASGDVSVAADIREPGHWGVAMDRWWRQFAAKGDVADTVIDGRSVDRPHLGQVSVHIRLAPGEMRTIPFVLSWRFPNRMKWYWDQAKPRASDAIGNWYAAQWPTAELAATDFWRDLPSLEFGTVAFVRSVLDQNAPDVVKEAALFNLTALRSETCFRTPDGNFFGWEGCGDTFGSCHGNCSHVWGYEHCLVDLWPDLARTMLDMAFGPQMDERGHMSFRVGLPLATAARDTIACADGQMQMVVRAFEYWRKSKDGEWLARRWPAIRRALAFAWVPGGWDADRDGVMEGCQHNTMDVEYVGPNPQMTFLYLCACRAAAVMARQVSDGAFADDLDDLFRRGSEWVEKNLFNGDYYEHRIVPITGEIAEGLRHPSMGARDLAHPDFQLGGGCLIDQLLGDYTAQVVGLAPVARLDHARRTMKTILEKCRQNPVDGSFNPMRTYAFSDEPALTMAWYPEGRMPQSAFPYYRETMTGFEYVVAALLAFSGDRASAERVVRDVRNRYDGAKRNPFDEAECGHHYVRALAAWSLLKAWAPDM